MTLSSHFSPKWLEPQLTHTSSRLNMTNSPEQQTNDEQNSDNRENKRSCEIREPDADHSAPPNNYRMTICSGERKYMAQSSA